MWPLCYVGKLHVKVIIRITKCSIRFLFCYIIRLFACGCKIALDKISKEFTKFVQELHSTVTFDLLMDILQMQEGLKFITSE